LRELHKRRSIKMRSGLAFAVVLTWLVFVVAAFAWYQFAGATAHPLGDYVASILKVIVIFIVAAALGLRLTARPRDDAANLVTATALGLALLGIATLALTAVGGLAPYIVWPVLAAAGMLCRRQIVHMFDRLRGFKAPAFDAFELVILGLMGIASVVALIGCLAPLTATDALVYHVNLPKTYSAAHGLASLPYNVYANMPHYGEMLYSLAFCVAGETGAKLFYFCLILASASSIHVLARKFVERRLALGAAAFFLVQPLVLDGRVVCNVDVLLAFLFVSSLIMLVDGWHAKPTFRRMIPVAVLAGFMLGTKYTAVAPSLALLAVALATPARPGSKMLVVAALVALAVVAPWLVRSEVNVGNPCYPMLEGTFDGRNWDSTQQAQLLAWQRNMGMGRRAGAYLLLPLNVSTKGKPGVNYTRFDGTITPVLLVLLPLALLKRDRRTAALLVVAAATFAFWALTSQQLRFLLPTIGLAAVLGAVGLANLAARTGPRLAGVILGLALLATVFSLTVPDQYGRPFLSGAFGDKLGVVLGLEPRQQYLDRDLQSYGMLEYIGRTLPAREPVFMMWENRGYYLDRPYFADSFFEASTLMRIVARARDPNDLKQTIRGMGFRYVLVNDVLGEVFSRYYPPAEVAKLRSFVASDLEPVHSMNKLTLYSLRP
jgi:hypothetical protein